MNNETLVVWLAIAVTVGVVSALVAFVLWGVGAVRRARHARHRGTVSAEPRHAVAPGLIPPAPAPAQAAREQRSSGYRLRPLTDERRERYSDEWRTVQARFAELPAVAVADAELLIQEVMHERGFPVADFEERKADVSVYYPQVVESYRQARLVAERNRSARASTDELRQALKHYRALFGTLLADRSEDHAAD